VKILVPLKRVPDPELKTKIADGKVDLSSVSWVVNPFDEYAVEAALRLVENADDGSRDGEVVVLTLGPEDAAQQLRSALAMGADRAIRIDAEDAAIDSGAVVDALIKVYEAEKPDLVLMGKQAVDNDANQVGQMLAGKLALAQATFAASIELVDDGKALVVGREVDAGVEYKKVPLPSVVTVDLRIVTPKAVINHKTPDSHEYQEGPRYASLKGIMKAKKKPMDNKSLGDLGVEPSPRTSEVGIELPPERAAGQIVESVEELASKLHNEAKVI
jgi:electron transfer flavoprotein beta subunit